MMIKKIKFRKKYSELVKSMSIQKLGVTLEQQYVTWLSRHYTNNVVKVAQLTWREDTNIK